MTYQPGEPPPYTPPQDPWSGTPGVASPPTDPIPQPPARGQFAQGVASPVAPSPGVWSQETVAHGYGGAPSPSGGGRAGLYVLVAVVVLLLSGAGGVGAWYLIKDRLGTPVGQGTETPGPSSTTETPFDPTAVRVGDCLFNRTPDEQTADMVPVSCDTPGAMQVLKIESGESIPQNAQGRFDTDTANAICLGTERWDGSWFGWNSTNNALDHFYCMDNLGS